MAIPAAIAPLVKSIFLREVRYNFTPADPENPTNGQYNTTAVVVGWDAYGDGNAPLGTYNTDLQLNPATAIASTTVDTIDGFQTLGRTLLHEAVKAAEVLVNAT